MKRTSYESENVINQQKSLIKDAAQRMGITPEAYLERDKLLRKKEEEDRMEAMDPNKSKFMSKEEKEKKLNAWKNRRFLELGIGHVAGEGQVLI